LVAGPETWVALVQDGGVKPHLTYDHLAKCLCLSHAVLRDVRSIFISEIKLSLGSSGQTLGDAASKAFTTARDNKAQENELPLTWIQLIDKTYWTPRLRASG